MSEELRIGGLDKFKKPEVRMSEDLRRVSGSAGDVAVTESVEIRGLEKFAETPKSEEPAIVLGAKIINRDSGEAYEVTSLHEAEFGSSKGTPMVTLQIELPGGGRKKVSKALGELERNLKTEGSAWHW